MEFSHPQLDGVWCRLFASDGLEILEMRDPNDGQGFDPSEKTRYQYAVIDGRLVSRRLPAESLGDCWRGETESPAWQPCHPREGSIITAWRDYCISLLPPIDPKKNMNICDQCGVVISDLDAGFSPALKKMEHDCGEDYDRPGNWVRPFALNHDPQYHWVVAFAPNGREVRQEGERLVVQPRNDNYWHTVTDIVEATRAYYMGSAYEPC